MTGIAERLAAVLADRYRIERELVAGGMATVYLAHDHKHGRPVALKVLKPELAAVLGPDRFRREIEIAAQLQHPHILSLHDSGDADGLLYYVMPDVEGETLRERLGREGPLPPADVARVLHDIADALAYAHARDVVHRDAGGGTGRSQGPGGGDRPGPAAMAGSPRDSEDAPLAIPPSPFTLKHVST